MKGDVADPQHCRDIIQSVVDELGGVDILVSNAAFQMSHDSLDEVPDKSGIADRHQHQRNVPSVQGGDPLYEGGLSAIIGKPSVNSDMPEILTLAPYAATKAAIANFCASLAQMLGEKWHPGSIASLRDRFGHP